MKLRHVRVTEIDDGMLSSIQILVMDFAFSSHHQGHSQML